MKTNNQLKWLFIGGLILTLLVGCAGAETPAPEPTATAEPIVELTSIPTSIPTETPIPISLLWSQKSTMPTPRFGHTASVVDGKIYVIGGGGPNGEMITAVDMYDPATDSWTKKADMPTGRKWFSTSVLDGKIYAIGGNSGSDWGGEPVATVEMYDPATDTWTTKADLLAARGDLATVVVDGKIYAIGGYIQKDDGEVVISGRVEVYNPVTDSWSLGKNMHISMEAKAVILEGKIYVTNGGTGEAYDPTIERWAPIEKIPGSVGGISISAVEGKIFSFGGVNGYSGLPVSSVYIYDHLSNTWAQLTDMPFIAWMFSISEVDGKMYLIGGLEQHWDESYIDPQPLPSVWEVSIDL